MKIFNFLIIVLIFISLASCTKKEEKISLIKEDYLEMQMIEAYNEGLKEFNRGDIFFAAKKFNEVELLYPQYDHQDHIKKRKSRKYFFLDNFEVLLNSLH